MLRHLAPLLLIACADPTRISITRVVPDHAEIDVAQPVMIVGTFHALASNLDTGDTTIEQATAAVGTLPLADVNWIANDRLDATMPGLSEGVYDVTVALRGQTATLSRAYIVGNPPSSDAGADGNNTVIGTHAVTVMGAVTGGPHADFPLLVALSDARLRTVGNGGEVTDGSGAGIFFSSDPAGTTPLAHELERFDGAAGTLVAWVRISSLTTGTTFYVHTNLAAPQNDPAMVWSNGFVAVWHLDDLTDSKNAITGTPTAVGATAGEIEQASSFNGTTSMIAMPISTAIDGSFAGGGTSEAWVFPTSGGGGNFGKVYEKNDQVQLGMCNADRADSILFSRRFATAPGNWCTNAGTAPLNTWTHVAVVYDDNSAANVPQIFINGAPATVTAITSAPAGARTSDAGTLVVGNRSAADRAFAGSIDELRMSHAVRSPGWIKTSFDNQSDPSNFVLLAP